MNKNNRKILIGTILVISILISSVLMWEIFYVSQEVAPSQKTTKIYNTLQNTPGRTSSADEPVVNIVELYSKEAILIRRRDKKVFLDMDSEKRIYPASMTKIMTVLIAIEKNTDLNARVTLPENIFPPLYRQNASMAGFSPEEVVYVIDLLYGSALPSGAEASIGLALYTSGSEEAFVDLMNQKASELGMKNTNFTNVTGLHDENHYSTVKDISVLLDYALTYDTFRNIFSSRKYTTSPTNKHSSGITFYSTMFSKIDISALTGMKILGGKTGFTDEAGLCLASYAKKDDEEYILVTAGAEGSGKTRPFHILDALTVYSKIS